MGGADSAVLSGDLDNEADQLKDCYLPVWTFSSRWHCSVVEMADPYIVRTEVGPRELRSVLGLPGS